MPPQVPRHQAMFSYVDEDGRLQAVAFSTTMGRVRHFLRLVHDAEADPYGDSPRSTDARRVRAVLTQHDR